MKNRNGELIDGLELLIRKRLGQKAFEPLHGRRHKRFDMSCNSKKNRDIIELFNDFEIDFGLGVDNYSGYYEVSFYKGMYSIMAEDIMFDDDIRFLGYRMIDILPPDSGGTVDIIYHLLKQFSNYKKVLRNENLETILKDE